MIHEKQLQCIVQLGNLQLDTHPLMKQTNTLLYPTRLIERMIEPSNKSRIYPKVHEKLKRKIEQGNPRNKLLMMYYTKEVE